MSAITGLKPEGLWKAFSEISAIPRESKHEEMITGYVARRAEDLGLRRVVDRAGNVVVYRQGMKPGPAVILQSHLDMVCEKGRDSNHDFRKDPIRLVREGDWIRADRTTLGADNGIGVAAMLALMEEKGLEHPDLELLFTIDEETGLTGANMLDPGLLKGRTLVNLDSEEDGTLIIGCAGGKNTDFSLNLTFEDAPAGHNAYLAKMTGLAGGHSGTDIHRGRGNAIKLLARFLKGLGTDLHCRLASFSGGSKHNVIPREAEAVIMLRPEDAGRLTECAGSFTATLSREFGNADSSISILIEEAGQGMTKVISQADAARVLDLIHGLPHGVMVMNESFDNSVVSSTNLAICSIMDGKFTILTNQRSAYRSSIDDISEMAASIGRLSGAEVAKAHDYPAWRPDFRSEVLSVTKKTYKNLFGEEPLVKIIHAGLECAVFGEKMPELDMISLGPTIEQAHSPSERVSISAVEKTWLLLTGLLGNLAPE